jgi:hypothetical protein
MVDPEISIIILGSCGKSVIPEGDWSIKPVTSSAAAPSEGFSVVITVTVPESMLTFLIGDTPASHTNIYNPSEVKEMKEGYKSSLLVFSVVVDCVVTSMRLNRCCYSYQLQRENFHLVTQRDPLETRR